MHKKKISLKVDNSVIIISGFYKNQIAKVKSINRKTGKIILTGLNFKFKHIKPNNKNESGEIKKIEAPIDSSNVKLIDYSNAKINSN